MSTGLILLRVRDAGHAQGRFLSTPAYFVPLRGGSGGEAPGGGSGLRAAGLPSRALQDGLFRFLLTLSAGSLEPEEALSLWEREERPQRERYGVTLSEGRQWAWLDDPEGPHTWPLGSVAGS
jgi:hypothetical protein